MQNKKWIILVLLRKNSMLSLIYPFLLYKYQSNENIEHLPIAKHVGAYNMQCIIT